MDGYVELIDCLEIIKQTLMLNIKLSVMKERCNNIIVNNEFKNKIVKINNEFYVEKSFLYNSIDLYKNSISFSEAIKKVSEYIKGYYDANRNTIKNSLNRRCKTFKIELIDLNIKFISNIEFNDVLNAIGEIERKECITGTEMLNFINDSFQGVEFGKTEKNIFKFILKNNLEVIDINHKGNFALNGEYMYPKTTVDMVFENIERYVKDKKVKLINLTYEEYFKLTKEKFNDEYEILDIDEFIEIGKYKEDNFNRIKYITRTFEGTGIKVIIVHKGYIYIEKNEYRKFKYFKNNYFQNDFFSQFGVEIKRDLAENNGIKISTFNERMHIHKDDCEEYIKIFNYNKEFFAAKTVYDKILIKTKYYPNGNANNFPKFIDNFFEFTQECSRNVRTFHYVGPLYNLYNVFLDTMICDLDYHNKKENNKLFNKIIIKIYEKESLRRIVLQFQNYLIDEKNFDITRKKDKTEKKTKKPYDKERFLQLLTRLIDIVGNEDNRREIYRDWNLSSVIAYIFMNYCVAWRKNDLINRLPTPNLKVVNGNSDGESFIRWLEAGNSISEEVAYKICNQLEEETKRLRLKAGKNQRELCCIIPDPFMKEIALILCINEANRQIHFNKIKRKRYENRVFNAEFVANRNIKELLIKYYDINIEEVLGGGFDNVRMTKSFLTLVKEKAEELGLSYSYYYGQVLRNHTPTKTELAETTKIYLEKNVSKASVMAFATGTMGSVKYILLKLIDEEFSEKNHNDKITAISNMNITPYQIEKNIQLIENKISVMNNEIEKFFRKGGTKESLLKELLYDQSCYGIERRTKCLLKITRDKDNGISRVRSKNFEEKKSANKLCPLNRRTCIGCEFMIALRYFIYEFEKRFNSLLDDYEFAEEELDKEIVIDSLKSIYLPVLEDLMENFEGDIKNIIDIDRYKKLSDK